MSVGSFLARRGWWKLNIEGSSLGNPGRAGAGGPIRVATNMKAELGNPGYAVCIAW
jgi:ribonuclease HI